MIQALPAILQFMLGFFKDIFNVYVTSSVLATVLVLWILDRVFGIFDILKHR